MAKGMEAVKCETKATGQSLKRETRLIYLGGSVHECADVTPEMEHRSSGARYCFRRYNKQLYDRLPAPLP